MDIGGASDGFRAVRNAFAPTVLHVAGPIDSTPDGLVVVPPAGGATITIYGQYLTNATSVTIGGSAAVFTAVNDNRITAIAPSHAAGGPFDLVVTTPDGSVTEADVIYYAVVPAWAAVVSPAPDPSVVTSASLREAIVATGYAWHVRTNDQFSIEMIVIPPGSFEMGCSASQQHGCDNDESPVHSVTITSPYYIGRYQVTQAQWNMVNAYRNSSYFDQDAGYADTGSWPAEGMSWNEIVTGDWATDLSGNQVFFPPWLGATSGLRLPTEAEWEYAYRAGTTTAYHGTPSSPGGSNDGSWDAHGDLKMNHEFHAGRTDKPVAGLLKDLKRRGLLDETIVIWGGEFGRQPTAEYAQGTGRDHNSYGFTMWMAGGGIKGGTTVGYTDELGSIGVDKRFHVKHLHATVLACMGLDPNHLTYFYAGLDQKLVGVEGAEPIREIMI